MTGEGSDFLQLDPRSAPPRNHTDWLVTALRTAVSHGHLPAGARLPPTRILAADLGFARGVVVEAYTRLREEGLVDARTGVGTTVTTRRPPPPRARVEPQDDDAPPRLPLLPSLQPSGIDLDLSPGVPDLSAFPRAAWLRAERTVLATAAAADLGYGDPAGAPQLRHQLSDLLARTRGIQAAADDILIVAGAAQAFALLAQVLTTRDVTTLAVEDPGSRGARDRLAHWGLRPVPVPVDAHGLRVNQLLISQQRAVMVTPAHQFPTGVVLHPQRRRALLDWAATHDGLVIEDDYDAEYRYDRVPVPALHASAPDRVVYTGTASKTLAPGMRLGWLIAPPHLKADVVEAKRVSDLGSPVLPQLVLAQLLAAGDYDKHLRQVRARQRSRRDALVAALHTLAPHARIDGVAAGLHLQLTLPHLTGTLDDIHLARQAAHVGVLVQPLSWHRHQPGPPGLVIGYAANSADRLREAVTRLAPILQPHLDGQLSPDAP